MWLVPNIANDPSQHSTSQTIVVAVGAELHTSIHDHGVHLLQRPGLAGDVAHSRRLGVFAMGIEAWVACVPRWLGDALERLGLVYHDELHRSRAKAAATHARGTR
jgi:hypothetical protein